MLRGGGYKYQGDCKDMNAVSANKGKLFETLKRIWNTVNSLFFYFLLFLIVGVWIGITVSKTYYNSKMEESIILEGMVYKGKLYTIIPK